MPNKKYATDEERRQATLMYAKKYREKNPEKYKESQEKYKINNPFAKQNALKKYRENNKDKIKKRRKELYDINKDAINKKRRKLIDKRIKYTNEDQRKQARSMYSKKYTDKNRKKVNKKMRHWRNDNKDHVREYRKKYYTNNKERMSILGRLSYSKHRHKRIIFQRILYRDQKEKYIAYSNKRRERKKIIGENFSESQIRSVYSKFKNKCYVCKLNTNLQVDHHYPLSKGFALTINNAVLLCRSCNLLKGVKLPETFYSPEQLTDLQLNYGISKSPLKEEQPSLFEARMPKNLERDNGLFEAMNAA